MLHSILLAIVLLQLYCLLWRMEADPNHTLEPFTVFESLPSTSCCSQKFPPNNLTCKVYQQCFQWVGGGDGLAGKGYSSKLLENLMLTWLHSWLRSELFTFARPSNGHICKWVWLTAARSDNSYLISGCGSLLASRQQQLYRWISGC